MTNNDQTFLIRKIRTQYTQPETSALTALQALDKKVKGPANCLAWSLGTLSALIMGSGMSLVMTDLADTLGISEPMVPGIVLGIVGMVLAACNYPLYKRILSRRKQKFAPQILAMSDKILAQ